MRIGIVGAGFTGLAAGLKLAQRGQNVAIFEKEEKPGGLAVGFRDSAWRWSIEKHYHHWFTSDWAARGLAKHVGHKVIFERPLTSIYTERGTFQLDSPSSLLKFPLISLLSRVRTGAALFYLRITPFWKQLEGITAERFIRATMGEEAWKVLWEPLFVGKFGDYAGKIPASWFWARIKKRSPSLGYPEGGFLSFAQNLDKAIRKAGGETFYAVGITKISGSGRKIKLELDNGKKEIFDKVICTLPTPLFLRITEGLDESYKAKLTPLSGLGAVNLLLSLKKKFLKKEYWLNINEEEYPFLAVVEHTNFMDKKYYAGERLVYVGNYLPHDHRYFKAAKEQLLSEFLPYLKKINPGFKKSWIKKTWLFKAPFAQPIVPLNYSKLIPETKTPIEGLYLANIQQVYPWDRGTNYAVELGQKVAQDIIERRL